MADLLMGADVGTSCCKVALVRADDGRVLATRTASYQPVSPAPGRMEQDPDTWYRALCDASSGLLADHPGAARELRGLGIAGQMRGVVLLDAAARAVRPAILWNDDRCSEEVAGIVGPELARVRAVTGNVLNTMCTLPKLLWLQRNEPASLACARTLLFPKDHVRLRVTGRAATDATDASGSSLFDVAELAWSTELVERYGIDPALLPEVLPAAGLAGAVTERAAKATGIPAGTPVVAGGSDSTVESFAIGLDDPGSCKIRLGTSGAASTVVNDPDLAGRAYVWAYVRPDRWMVDTNTRACGQSVRWLRDVAYSEIAGDGDAFGAIDAEASVIPAGAEGLLFHPHLLGEDAPYWDPHLRGTFLGLTARHGRAHLARAVLEGTAFALRDAMSVLGPLVDGFRRYLFVGGGTLSPTWLAIVADVLGVGGEVPETSDAALGAAMLAGVGTGVFPDLEAAVGRCRRVRTHLDVDPRRVAAYDVLFRRYRATLPASREAGP